jgi:hypothetical protein
MSIQILTVLISNDFGEMELDLQCLNFVLVGIPKKHKNNAQARMFTIYNHRLRYQHDTHPRVLHEYKLRYGG